MLSISSVRGTSYFHTSTTVCRRNPFVHWCVSGSGASLALSRMTTFARLLVMRWRTIGLLYLNSYFAMIVFCLYLNETALCATPGVNPHGVLYPVPLCCTCTPGPWVWGFWGRCWGWPFGTLGFTPANPYHHLHPHNSVTDPHKSGTLDMYICL